MSNYLIHSRFGLVTKLGFESGIIKRLDCYPGKFDIINQFYTFHIYSLKCNNNVMMSFLTAFNNTNIKQFLMLYVSYEKLK